MPTHTHTSEPIGPFDVNVLDRVQRTHYVLLAKFVRGDAQNMKDMRTAHYKCNTLGHDVVRRQAHHTHMQPQQMCVYFCRLLLLHKYIVRIVIHWPLHGKNKINQLILRIVVAAQHTWLQCCNRFERTLKKIQQFQQ